MKFKTGIIAFNNGAFGGAARRITNLFFYLREHYPSDFYYFVNPHLFEQINIIFPDKIKKDIIIIDDGIKPAISNIEMSANYHGTITDPHEVDRNASLIRKYYWYYKNKFRQKKIYDQLEAYRKKYDINVLNGIAAGALPLNFYLKNKDKKAAIIFSDMDSWFTDVHKDMNKLWYRKYYSYNYLLENADVVDFLSPFIAEGLKKYGVKVKDENTEIAPCSFIDRSMIKVSSKKNFGIAYSSRLEPEKNPILYLETAKEIIKEYPDIKFYLLGEGSLANEIDVFIKINGLRESVIFNFEKNPSNIFADTSIFVSLQSGTNYPSQSVLEAMACENVVIASRRGDTQLLINKDNGILVELDKSELLDAIKKLITNPELCRRLAINGRDIVLKEHTIEKYVNYYLRIINKAYKKIM